MEEPKSAEATSNPSVLPLYMGLFLTLLAFFILFVGTSRRDHPRPQAVATGVSSAEPRTNADDDVNMRALSAVAAAFGRLGATMPATYTAGGLDVDVPARSLFPDHTASIRPAAMAAIDRAATALAAPRRDSRFALQVTIGFGNRHGGAAAAVARAAGVATALLQRGAPPEAFATGTAPLTNDAIRFRFRLLDDHEDLATAF